MELRVEEVMVIITQIEVEIKADAIEAINSGAIITVRITEVVVATFVQEVYLEEEIPMAGEFYLTLPYRSVFWPQYYMLTMLSIWT